MMWNQFDVMSVACRLYCVRQCRIVVVGNVEYVGVEANDLVLNLMGVVPEKLVTTGVVFVSEVR
jgi:hypothetical protein